MLLDGCTCGHIEHHMECLRCGYPYSEAREGDDGSDCRCQEHRPLKVSWCCICGCYHDEKGGE